jgi:hypothetical protein
MKRGVPEDVAVLLDEAAMQELRTYDFARDVS